jgi:CBS domain-containing protein
MIAKDLINYMIPPLKPTDPVDKARQWMEELRISELPVSDQGRYLGLLSDDMLYNEESLPLSVGELPLIAAEVAVHKDNHYYDVLKEAYAHGVRIVAILDDSDNYLGVVSIENVIEAFAGTASVATPGAILILNLEYRDYYLSEISRIIEANEAKILSSHLSNNQQEVGLVILTLKLNVEDATHIISSLDAKGFKVTDSFNKNEINESESDRFDNLMNYLNL